MSNIESDFRTKAKAVGQVTYGGRPQSPGFYNPDGSTASMDSRQMRAERVVAAGRGGATNPIRLGVGEIMPETAGRPSAPNFTLRGSVPAGNALVPTDGFDPAMRGKTSPLPPTPMAPPAPGPGLGARLKAGYQSAVAGPTIGELGRASLSRAKAVLTSKPVMLAGRAARFVARGVPLLAGAADAAGMVDVATDDKMGTSDVAEQGGRLAGRWGAAGAGAGFGVKLGAAAGALTGPAAPVAVPAFSLIGGLAGGAVGYMGAEKLMDAGAGQTAPDERSNGIVKKTLGLGDAAKVSVLPAAQPTQETVTPVQEVATEAAAQQPTLSPWNRSDDLATEAKRQFTNATPIQDGGNGLLAQAEAGLSRARGQYAQGGEGGARAFRDPAVQAAFNARNMLEGTGIAVNTTKDGRTEFSGDNRAGGGQLYRAADGSVTNDWSKTQQYADAIQRNAKDQDRLAELTRGAALSGDKEAVARLTAGDQRLAGIAAEAATEKSLRDAVKGGSRNAAMVLADMEKSKATQAYQNVDLGLKRAALVSAQEDRDLNRQLRQDSLNVKVAENKRVAEKDTRETAQARVTTLDKQLEQYATVKGELDGQKVARLRGLAANLQPSPGQSPEEFNKDVTTHVGLASKLDGMQAFYDRWFSQAGQGGTDLRQWRPNDSIRGGFVTDQGDHISTGQYNSLTDDEKAVFKKLYLKGGK